MLIHLLEGLLERLIPASDRDELLGDLREERSRVARRGRWARGWHAGQLVQMVSYYVVFRVGAFLRHAGIGASLPAFRRDVRLAFRQMLKHPGVTAATALPLALGISAVTTLFVFVYGVLIRPLPLVDPDRVFRLGERALTEPADRIASTSPANFLDLDAGVRAFESLAAYQPAAFNLSGGELPTRVLAMRVTYDFFEVLGVPIAPGRDFSESDDRAGAEPVVIVSRALSRQLFAAGTAALGEWIVLDGTRRRVVGVAPAALSLRGAPLLWVPFAWTAWQRGNRRGRSIEMIGRLRPGVPEAAGMAELDRLTAGIAAEYPDTNAGVTVGGMAYRSWLIGTMAPRRLLLFSGAAALVFLIAFVNVTNLALARGEMRRPEIAVRVALGAGRAQVAGMLIIESMVSALLGGTLAVALSLVAVDTLPGYVGEWIPRTGPLGVDLMAITLTVVAAVGVGVLLGMVSARHCGAAPARAGRRLGVRRGFVVAQITLSLVLLVGAILLGASLARLRRVELGMVTSGAVSFELPLPAEGYDTDGALQFYDRVLRETSTIPGVESVAAQNRPLFSNGGNAPVATLDGEPWNDDRLVETREVTPGFFATLGVELDVGRGFVAADRSGAPVAVVNRAFARAFLGDGPLLGRRFRIAYGDKEFHIVGVAGDVRDLGLDADPAPTAYFVFGNGPWGTFPPLTFVVRARDPAAAVPLIRSRVARIDHDVPLANITLLDELARRQLGDQRRTAAFLFYAFSSIALALAISGVYAVVSYAVSSAAHDISVRQALGATTGDIRWLVLRQGVSDSLLGVALGIPVAISLSGTLAGLLFEIEPIAAPVLAAAAIVVVSVSLGACLIPARRAAALDPMLALRGDG